MLEEGVGTPSACCVRGFGKTPRIAGGTATPLCGIGHPYTKKIRSIGR